MHSRMRRCTGSSARGRGGGGGGCGGSAITGSVVASGSSSIHSPWNKKAGGKRNESLSSRQWRLPVLQRQQLESAKHNYIRQLQLQLQQQPRHLHKLQSMVVVRNHYCNHQGNLGLSFATASFIDDMNSGRRRFLHSNSNGSSRNSNSNSNIDIDSRTCTNNRITIIQFPATANANAALAALFRPDQERPEDDTAVASATASATSISHWQLDGAWQHQQRIRETVAMNASTIPSRKHVWDAYAIVPPNVSKVAATAATAAMPPFQSYGRSWSLPWFNVNSHSLLLRHFLPAHHPHSVAPGYLQYCAYCCTGAIAGSASMVLSTQTLLMAVVVGADAGVIMTNDASDSDFDASTTSTGSNVDSVKPETSASTTASSPPPTSSTTTTAVASGALNWVLKDGLGQLGGVLVASRLLSTNTNSTPSSSNNAAVTNTLDAHPKVWRIVAAVTLDLAAGLELLTPVVAATLHLYMPMPLGLSSTMGVVLWASLANVIKNVGFVAASASRASLHQSLAISSNLADVTAKSASQGMVAGLLGTLLGVATSSVVINAATTSTLSTTTAFAACYGVLTLIHQYSVYQAVRCVGIRQLNRPRLSIVLQHYVATRAASTAPTAATTATNGSGQGMVLTPRQVAELEPLWPDSWSTTLPLIGTTTRSKNQNDQALTSSTSAWLFIGTSVERAFPDGPSQLLDCLEASHGAHHVLNYGNHSSSVTATRDHKGEQFDIHLVFMDAATTGNDVLIGMLHAFLLRGRLRLQQQQQRELESLTLDAIDSNDTMATFSISSRELIHESYQQALLEKDALMEQLQAMGWDVGAIRVEDAHRAMRLSVSRG